MNTCHNQNRSSLVQLGAESDNKKGWWTFQINRPATIKMAVVLTSWHCPLLLEAILGLFIDGVSNTDTNIKTSWTSTDTEYCWQSWWWRFHLVAKEPLSALMAANWNLEALESPKDNYVAAVLRTERWRTRTQRRRRRRVCCSRFGSPMNVGCFTLFFHCHPLRHIGSPSFIVSKSMLPLTSWTWISWRRLLKSSLSSCVICSKNKTSITE